MPSAGARPWILAALVGDALYGPSMDSDGQQQAAESDPWLVGVLGGMRKLSGEVELLNFLGDALDDALVAHRLDRCAALLESLSVGDLPDDVALTALIVTRPAGLPLREVRERYADRVRSELAKRGWAVEDISLAVDCLF